MKEHEGKIRTLYRKYFKKLSNSENDASSSKKKLATLPFIGSEYGKRTKVLFVGLDIGSDEKDHIQTISERRMAIEHPEIEYYNPHIAGTYFLALYFLQHEENWIEYWKSVKKMHLQSMQILKNFAERERILPNPYDLNFMSYVSLTNANKYVTIGRKNKFGDQDRKSLSSIEMNLLNDEIEILKPEIICFQGKGFWKKIDLVRQVKRENNRVFIGTHPSCIGKIREPARLADTYREWE